MAVSGATGFLGRHFCEHFRDRGWEVRALARRRDDSIARDIRTFHCDLPDDVATKVEGLDQDKIDYLRGDGIFGYAGSHEILFRRFKNKSAEEIEAYQTDGIVCLRGLFDSDWVDFLRARVEEDIADPSGMVKNINAEGATGEFFGDTFVCHHNTGFMKAVFDSPGAAIAGGCMGADKVNLIFDQILVKEPGTTTPTIWHHDATYWPVAGQQIGGDEALLLGQVKVCVGRHHGPYAPILATGEKLSPRSGCGDTQQTGCPLY